MAKIQVKPITQILDELPAFTKSLVWGRLAGTLGWRMMNSALRYIEITEAEAKAVEAGERSPDDTSAAGCHYGDDLDHNRESEVETTSPTKDGDTLNPAQWLYELEDTRGAAVDQARACYRDAKVSFKHLLDRACTVQTPNDASRRATALAYADIADDPDFDMALMEKSREAYQTQMAERFRSHRAGIMDTLQVHDTIGADFDEAFDEAHPQVQDMILQKLIDILQTRVEEATFLRPADWVNKVPPMALYMERKLMRAALVDLRKINMALSLASRTRNAA
jgi:hypothetical protein